MSWLARAAHVDHRRRPAHDLLDRRAARRVEVGPPRLPLLGVAGQRQHAVADRVAGGLVAGDDQQDEERGDLGASAARRRPRPAPGWWSGRRPGSSAGPRPARWRRRRCPWRTCKNSSKSVAMSGSPKPRMTLVQWKTLCVVLFGDAHHVADDLQRQRARQRRHELAGAVGMVGDHRVHQPAGPLAHRVLDPGDHLGVNAC